MQSHLDSYTYECIHTYITVHYYLKQYNVDVILAIIIESRNYILRRWLYSALENSRCQYTYIYKRRNLLVTVKIPELVILPIIFEELQVYVPTSDDVTLYTVNVFSVVVMFNDLDTIMYLLLLSDAFIITPLKYQLMSGTGSPTA